MKKKKVIILSIIVIIIIVITVASILIFQNSSNKNEEPEKIYYEEANGYTVNNSEKFMENNDFGAFIFKNVQIMKTNEICVFTGIVENKKGEDIVEQEIKGVFYNDKGEEIGEIPIVIANVKNGEEVEIRTQTYENIIGAYSFSIK